MKSMFNFVKSVFRSNSNENSVENNSESQKQDQVSFFL